MSYHDTSGNVVLGLSEEEWELIQLFRNNGADLESILEALGPISPEAVQ